MNQTIQRELEYLDYDEKLALISQIWDSIDQKVVPVPQWHSQIITERMNQFEYDVKNSEYWQNTKKQLLNE